MNKAVLLITFNRLDYVQKVFEQIRLAKVPKLYIFSDGPRKFVENEKETIETIRNWILNNIDWKCDIKTMFLEVNSGGCAYGIPSAVNWFFENEPDGIILEDDCVPSRSFFDYCETLLDMYRDNKKIWHITGYGYYQDNKAKDTYYFAKIQHCWGWASWADRWKYFKLDLQDYDTNNLKNFSNKKYIQEHMKNLLNRLNSNEHKETWAWPWAFEIVAHKGYCINPYKNLISNIGINGEHYKGNNDISNSLETKIYEIEKIIHPKKIKFNYKAINFIYKNHYGIIKPHITLRKRITTIIAIIKHKFNNR